MAKKFSITVSIIFSFKLLMLALIIFAALTFIPQGQPTQVKATIAAVTVFAYGISDMLLRTIMGWICNCDNHS